VPDAAGGPSWFGPKKKENARQWQSWLTMMSCPRTTTKVSSAAAAHRQRLPGVQQMFGLGPLSYEPTANTLHGWELADATCGTSWSATGCPR